MVFDAVPVFLVELGLLVIGKPHKDIVADLITFAQVKSRGVQAFKDELRVVLVIQGDVDDLQSANGIKQLIDAQFFSLNAVIEVLIIYRQIRIRNG